MIGRTIGKYRIVGQLGRGGAGVVYKAVDETLHRDVAVKTLNPDLANTEVMSRFRAEATILARLNHPQIATIYELFRADGDLLMVMEFVRGESLDKLSERVGAIAPERAAYVIDQILSALEHAHRGGVVHRDVKPANVMVTDEGSIKIMDFGIARVLGAEQKTVDFRLMGTPAYMSPEQVLGEEVDGRSDLYSVGVLFYRLLTGALPFAADTALGMLQRQIRDTPIPLCAHRGGLPDWCEAIVQKALAKTQSDRFQSAEEFREALSRATGPLPMADIAKTFAAEGRESLVPRADRDRDARPFAAAAAWSPPPRRPLSSRLLAAPKRATMMWAEAAVAVLVFGVVAVAYVMLRGDATRSGERTHAAAASCSRRSQKRNRHRRTQPVETVADDAAAREKAQRLKPFDRRRLNQRRRSHGCAGRAAARRQPSRAAADRPCPSRSRASRGAGTRRRRVARPCRRRGSDPRVRDARARRHAQVEGAGRAAPDGRRKDHDHPDNRIPRLRCARSPTAACLRSACRAVAIRCGTHRRDRHRSRARAGRSASLASRSRETGSPCAPAPRNSSSRCASMKCC